MRTLEKNGRIIIGSAAIVLLLAVGLAIFFSVKNKSLHKSLDNEKLKNEEILSEKLLLDKQIADMMFAMETLKGKNKDLDKLLQQTNKTIADKDSEIRQLLIHQKNNKGLSQKLAELKKSLNDAQSKIAEMLSRADDLDAENQALKKSIADLQSENQKLKDQEALRILIADNYRIESQKRKPGTLTAFSGRTKKLITTFDVPQQQATNINFKVTLPDGSKVADDSKAISWVITDKYERQDFASINGGGIEVTKRIQMTYDPKLKFKKGIYKVEMFNNGEYIGSCQLRLK